MELKGEMTYDIHCAVSHIYPDFFTECLVNQGNRLLQHIQESTFMVSIYIHTQISSCTMMQNIVFILHMSIISGLALNAHVACGPSWGQRIHTD